MKLMDKLKDFSRAVVFSTVALSTLGGCATYTSTPWQTVRETYQPTGIQKQIVLETAPEKENVIQFEIGNPYREEGESKIPITETLHEINFETRTIGTEREFEKFLIQEQETTIGFNNLRFLVAWTAVGGVGGGILNAAVGGVGEGVGLRGGLTGALLLGSIAGLSIVADKITSPDPKPTTETRTARTYELTYRLSPSRTTEIVPQANVLIYQSEPASHISVNISMIGNDDQYTTDVSGRLNLSEIADSLNPQYFFRNYSSAEFQERIRNIPLVQQIKPRALETLMDDLALAISPTDRFILRISTEEESSRARDVINDSRSFYWGAGRELTNEAIYAIVRQFVDEEINSNIKSLTFVVRDNISHTPIDGSNFEFRLNAPRREDLAGEYFTQHLKDYAEEHIRNYLEGNTTLTGVPSRVFFNIYTPSMIQLEVTNPGYNFVNGVIVMDNEDSAKNVYMVERGSMIRVQDADNERGRIE